MANKRIVFFFLLPVVVSFILHFRVFKLDVIGYHAWRQTQTQTVIYNFTASDNNILHPQKFDLRSGSTALLYEFPLYQWLIAQVNNVLGYSVMHTRLCSFIIFCFLLLGFYRLLRHFVSVPVALITNALLCFSPLLYYYGVNPLPDTFALCLATWALHYFFSFLFLKKEAAFILFCFFLSLAALVKLPFILYGSVLLVYACRELKQKHYAVILKKAFLCLLFLIPVAAWYIRAIPTWKNNNITTGLLENNKTIAQLFDFLQFHAISSVPELLTNYAACIFLFTGIYLFFKRIKLLQSHHAYFIMLFAVCSAYFLFELNMIEKTHDYYLMPFIPLLFLVAAYGVKFYYEKQYYKFVLAFVCLVPLTAWLRIDTRWNTATPGFVTDYLEKKEDFNALLPAEAKCIIDYDDSRFISLYYLKRQGYSLYKGEISPAVLSEYYHKGAAFLVTENMDFDINAYNTFNFEALYNHNLKIYKLTLK